MKIFEIQIAIKEISNCTRIKANVKKALVTILEDEIKKIETEKVSIINNFFKRIGLKK